VTARKKSFSGSLLELAVIVVVALGLALLVQAFLVKPYKIPSTSMVPTLTVGQRVLVDRVGLHFVSLKVGDIVVFHPPKDYTACQDPDQGQSFGGQSANQACDVAQPKASTTTFIKRLVGLPGDRLQISNGHVIRNGKREADPYTVPCDGASDCNFPGTIVVPPGEYYMMGDNRPDSEDSRFWGPVRRAWIIGTAFLTYWPPDRIGGL
jgi:signal peptidase I